MNVGVFNILCKRYPPTEYATMCEVSNAAGFSRSRSCDFMVMGLWPSRGLHLQGFELKVSRSDFLSELKKPDKADAFYNYCDFWWLLTVHDEHRTVAKLEEIPAPWGWLEIKGEKCIVRKDAPKNENVQPVGRHFLAAMLKRAADRKGFIHESEIADKIRAAGEQKAAYEKRQAEQYRDEVRDLHKKINDFKHASGIDIDFRWGNDPRKFGEAVRFLMNGGNDQARKELEDLAARARRIHESIASQLAFVTDCIPEQKRS